MSTTATQNPDGSCTLTDDATGTTRHLSLVATNSNGRGLVEVHLKSEAGAEQGTPTRYKLSNSGDRVARDEPGVDPTYFIVTPGNTITNG